MTVNGLYINVSASEFHFNSALQGGVLRTSGSNMHATIRMSEFSNNNASQGGVVYASNSAILIRDVDVYLNSANLGVMYLIDSTGIFSDSTQFSENQG